MWNNLKTTILLAALTGLLLVIGQTWGGQRGMEFARELYMPAVNRVERAAQNSECAIRHGGRAAALKSASRVLAGMPLPEQ